MMRTFLCFDIGGSKYNVGLLRQDGTILARQKSLWHGHSQQEMLAELFCAGHAVLAQCPGQAPCAAGATIPGLADAASGMWVEASFSGIRNVPIAHLLEQEFGLPAAIENDARACALAERMFGAGKDVDDFFYVTVSNGIGGALFLNGALYTGALGNAGEIGHCTAVENGRPCGCGKRGCLEAHAAGPAISKNYLELGGTPDEAGTPPAAKEIAARARTGEAAALRTFELEGRLLGTALAQAVNLLNPARVILGGGVSLAYDLFGPKLEQTLGWNIYRKASGNVDVMPTPLGYDGGLYAAAALAILRAKKG